MDTLKVRRATAPPWKTRGKGDLKLARKMLKSKANRELGEAKLLRDRFAPTTHRARASRIGTLKLLVRDAGFELVPVTVLSLNVVAAALKAGGYRTGISYITMWESLHREAGHEWTTDLAQAKQWARKSIERGLGPNKHAATVLLEKLVSNVASDSLLDMAIVGALWMLRGAELAGLLIEQAKVEEDESAATFILGAHKTNSEAHRCERTLK